MARLHFDFLITLSGQLCLISISQCVKKRFEASTLFGASLPARQYQVNIFKRKKGLKPKIQVQKFAFYKPQYKISTSLIVQRLPTFIYNSTTSSFCFSSFSSSAILHFYCSDLQWLASLPKLTNPQINMQLGNVVLKLNPIIVGRHVFYVQCKFSDRKFQEGLVGYQVQKSLRKDA